MDSLTKVQYHFLVLDFVKKNIIKVKRKKYDSRPTDENRT